MDLLVFAPHPDDAEIGLGASIARHTAEGYSVGIVDLTAGELSSNGTPAGRRAEADVAAKVLGLAVRENLRGPHGGDAKTPGLVGTAARAIRPPHPQADGDPRQHGRP